MIPALAVALLLIAVYAAGLLLGRLMRSKLEKTAFFSSLSGFAVVTISPLVLLRELGIGGAQQSFEITPGVVVIALTATTWVVSLGCALALAAKRRS